MAVNKQNSQSKTNNNDKKQNQRHKFRGKREGVSRDSVRSTKIIVNASQKQRQRKNKITEVVKKMPTSTENFNIFINSVTQMYTVECSEYLAYHGKQSNRVFNFVI